MAAALVAALTLVVPGTVGARSAGIFDRAKTGCGNGCHTQAVASGWPTTQAFVTGLPSMGYEPGTTYELNVWVLGIALPAPMAIGFNLEASDGFLSTDDPGVKTVNETECDKLERQNCSPGNFGCPDSCDDQEIVSIQATHDGPRQIVAGSLSFSLEWEAPEAGTGDVLFWVAGNVVNGNGLPDTSPGPFLDLWNVMEPVTVSEAE